MRLTTLFDNTIDIVYRSIGDEAFRPVKAINAAVFDAVMIGIATRLSEKKIEDLKTVKENYEILLAKPEFIESYKTSTSDEKVVQNRIQLAIEAFEDVQ